MKYIYIIGVFLLFSCSNNKDKLTAQQIVDKSIEVSGLDKINKTSLSFKFRDKNYNAVRNNGVFKLNRTFDSIKDEITNTGFKRFINDKQIELSDSLSTVYTNSVNSIHYFSVLPYGLNDKAVHKKLLPSVSIKGKDYYKVEITFSKNGGGEDFEDVFIYWINKQTFLVEYLAYSYKTDGGGKRFRDIINEQNIKGIRFVNYNNYKPKSKEIPLINLDKAFEENQLTKVSEIILEDIQVKL
ncbi:MAG: deoxyribose-phosphate aldolase [Flavobacteriaceae bacterium]|nr:deoxyribose-phosphate aldolase [Flavobacteriaceae bacterium]